MKIYKIGELCSFSKGASIPRDRMLQSGTINYLHYGDLYKGHNLYINIEDQETPIPFISSFEKAKDSQYAKDGDIVYVLTSETVEDLGKALLLQNPNHQIVVAGTETTIMHVDKKDIIEPAYLNYLLQTKCFKKTLQQYTTGMKVFRVHPRDISRIEIKVPNIEKQRAIIKILDQIHFKIRINNRINDYLSELIEAIFVEWFVGANSRYPTKKVLMDEIAFVNAGGDKPDVWQKCQTEEFPIPIFSNGIDNEGLYGYTTTAKITKPSITVSARGTIGFTCLRHEPYYPIVRLVSATPRDYVTAEYLYLWVKRATVIGVGTTQQQLTVPMFKNYEVDVPDATSMEEFTRVTTPLFKMVDANKAENRKLSELRNALLPKLISGEVDISKVVI